MYMKEKKNKRNVNFLKTLTYFFNLMIPVKTCES